jgi:hypothetical protein
MPAERTIAPHRATSCSKIAANWSGVVREGSTKNFSLSCFEYAGSDSISFTASEIFQMICGGVPDSETARHQSIVWDKSHCHPRLYPALPPAAFWPAPTGSEAP